MLSRESRQARQNRQSVLSTDMGKSEKIKGLWLSFSPFLASFNSKFAKLNQTGFLWMQPWLKLFQTHLYICQKSLAIWI